MFQFEDASIFDVLIFDVWIPSEEPPVSPTPALSETDGFTTGDDSVEEFYEVDQLPAIGECRAMYGFDGEAFFFNIFFLINKKWIVYFFLMLNILCWSLTVNFFVRNCPNFFFEVIWEV